MATRHVVLNKSYRSAEEISDRLVALVGENGGHITPGTAAATEWNALNEARDEMNATQARMRTAARGAGTTESLELGQPNFRREQATMFDDRGTDREAALRAIERHSGELTAQANDRLDDLVRRQDISGLDSRYLAAVADPHYNSAFGKMLQHGPMAPMRFSPEEAQAVQKVNAAEELRTTLQVGSDAAGGFAVPYTLDPSIVLTSAGAQCAVRDYARVETISTDKWKGVSSAGVTAAFAAELTEASDNAPVLAQPTADSNKAQAFVPFSIEIGQDWASLQNEMPRLIADAKATLEATEFLSGNGVDRPSGILSGATTVVTGAGTAVYAIADAYSLVQALPPRFQANAVVAASPTIFDVTYRFVGGGSTEPPVLPTREGRYLGREKFEWSTMSATQATGQLNLIVGDWQHYLIADRVGMSIELIPHLFGSGNRFPIGARGLYAYWRTATTTLTANAFRVLKMK